MTQPLVFLHQSITRKKFYKTNNRMICSGALESDCDGHVGKPICLSRCFHATCFTLGLRDVTTLLPCLGNISPVKRVNFWLWLIHMSRFSGDVHVRLQRFHFLQILNHPLQHLRSHSDWKTLCWYSPSIIYLNAYDTVLAEFLWAF